MDSLVPWALQLPLYMAYMPYGVLFKEILNMLGIYILNP